MQGNLAVKISAADVPNPWNIPVELYLIEQQEALEIDIFIGRNQVLLYVYHGKAQFFHHLQRINSDRIGVCPQSQFFQQILVSVRKQRTLRC